MHFVSSSLLPLTILFAWSGEIFTLRASRGLLKGIRRQLHLAGTQSLDSRLAFLRGGLGKAISLSPSPDWKRNSEQDDAFLAFAFLQCESSPCFLTSLPVSVLPTAPWFIGNSASFISFQLPWDTGRHFHPEDAEKENPPLLSSAWDWAREPVSASLFPASSPDTFAFSRSSVCSDL